LAPADGDMDDGGGGAIASHSLRPPAAELMLLLHMTNAPV